MTDAQQREAARQFYYRWNGKGKEDEDARSYWIEILTNILGVENVTERVSFEKKVIGADGNTKRIDVYIPETRVLIEQKSLGIILDKPQAGHGGKTPYEQAKEYDNGLPFDEKSRWIITSNFSEIWIYDMNQKKPEPVKIMLEDLQAKYHVLDFLVNKGTKKISREMDLSLKAGEIVGVLYDAFHKQYKDPDAPETLKSLNKLCVRIVFCLYGEDAGIFGKKNMFHDYMAQFDANHARKGLRDLFRVLNQRQEDRDPYLADDDPQLAAFPYVNGGLFDGDDIEIPPFTDEILDLLLTRASDDFDWSGISPTIFGAVFESTLNPETRRSAGMHYTSLENIHKVIDPLFLDALTDELNSILYENAKKQEELREELKKQEKEHSGTEAEIRSIGADIKAYQRHLSALEGAFTRKRNVSLLQKVKELDVFQEKLSKLCFLDPACGSGNFLTETYLSLRRLENIVIRERMDVLAEKSESELTGQISLFDQLISNPIKVSIGQFYGIEINDFAVTVARTALWIAENQMMKETEDIIHANLDFLPLKTNSYIVEGNALQLDWEKIISKKQLSYIMGNPPFVGGMYMSELQKKEIRKIFDEVKGAGEFDYVTGWYKKSVEYIRGTTIQVAFVSTNSICQGEQVTTFWKHMMTNYTICINFAYPTFVWDNGTKGQARVHCVIVGFSFVNTNQKRLFYPDGNIVVCENISPYLTDTPNVFIESRSTPLYNVPAMRFGSMPRDGGGFILSKEEADELSKKEPLASKWIRPYIGAVEFLHNKERYCLWLVNANPSEINKCPTVKKRIEYVREFRSKSKAAGTRKFAQTPSVFCQIAQPNTDYIMIPETSSGRRRIIPMGFQHPDVIASNLVFLIPNASLYEFGILMSNLHNAWVRCVAGRLKSDYRYSKDIVYNTFPWPSPNEKQKDAIITTASKILEIRANYPDCDLSTLYDPDLMPADLSKAHNDNNRAVMRAYGMPIKETNEATCVAWLMRMYQEKVAEVK